MNDITWYDMATGTAARILGADDLGTIRPGSRADLVLLDADPLEDIRNTRRIAVVLQAGRVIDHAALAALWARAVTQRR